MITFSSHIANEEKGTHPGYFIAERFSGTTTFIVRLARIF